MSLDDVGNPTPLLASPESAARFAGTPRYPLALFADPRAAGKQAHIGDGVWATRCRFCPTVHVHDGVRQAWDTIGPHEREKHDADVAGINVGILC